MGAEPASPGQMWASSVEAGEGSLSASGLSLQGETQKQTVVRMKDQAALRSPEQTGTVGVILGNIVRGKQFMIPRLGVSPLICTSLQEGPVDHGSKPFHTRVLIDVYCGAALGFQRRPQPGSTKDDIDGNTAHILPCKVKCYRISAPARAQ